MKDIQRKVGGLTMGIRVIIARHIHKALWKAMPFYDDKYHTIVYEHVKSKLVARGKVGSIDEVDADIKEGINMALEAMNNDKSK